MKSTDILKYFEGESSANEKEQLVDWLDGSPEHLREFNQIRFIFEVIKMYGPELRSTDFLRKEEKRRKGRGMLHVTISGLLRIAAVLILFLGGGYWIHVRTHDALASQLTSLDVPAGQRIAVTLSDGSHIWLNSGAHIEYPVVFGRNERSVKLSGEAMFEVKHDSERPFVVHTFASKIEVLGTKFNTLADVEHNYFSTTLLEGKLRITELGSNQSVILHPNDEARLIDNRFVVDHVFESEADCWTRGLISIRGLSFQELMRKFEKAYNIRIEIRREKMPTLGFSSGKFRISDGIDHALHVLQHNSDFQFKHDMEKNLITIY